MEKNVVIDNFVGIFDGFVSQEQCETLIDYYEWCVKNNRTWNRKNSEGTPSHIKKDNACGMVFEPGNDISYDWPNIARYMGNFNKVFWDECYPLYVDRYSSLNTSDRLTIYTYKLQKTLPGEGYHVWHCENLGRTLSSRVCTYILYLNDVAEGGETELLYQGMRIEPRTGRLLIFPAGYTHTHRGNPPLSGEKYILTGWIELS